VDAPFHYGMPLASWGRGPDGGDHLTTALASSTQAGGIRDATASLPALTLTNVTPHPCRESRESGAGYHGTSWRVARM
jgi:hypothetical protein